MRRLASLLVSMMSVGCYPDPGPCDEPASLELVYDAQGTPAFAGQAMVIRSCGAGGHCHSEDVGDDLRERYGAPAGLNFDLRLASTTYESDEEPRLRLCRNDRNLRHNPGLAWYQVSSGHMPPPLGSAARDRYEDAVQSIVYQRYADDGTPGDMLPLIDTPEGQEIFRNWLACGAPVVERTQQRVDGFLHERLPGTDLNDDCVPDQRDPFLVGHRVGICETRCVAPTWRSIYSQIIATTCALSSCHDDASPEGDLDMSSDTAAFANLLGQLAQGSDTCRLEGRTRLVAGDPQTSLIYLKVSAASSEDVCGSKMPLAGNPLTDQRLCAIREWITCGACGPDDTSCAACETNIATACGVVLPAPGEPDPGEAYECADPQPCANGL